MRTTRSRLLNVFDAHRLGLRLAVSGRRVTFRHTTVKNLSIVRYKPSAYFRIYQPIFWYLSVSSVLRETGHSLSGRKIIFRDITIKNLSIIRSAMLISEFAKISFGIFHLLRSWILAVYEKRVFAILWLKIYPSFDINNDRPCYFSLSSIFREWTLSMRGELVFAILRSKIYPSFDINHQLISEFINLSFGIFRYLPFFENGRSLPLGGELLLEILWSKIYPSFDINNDQPCLFFIIFHLSRIDVRCLWEKNYFSRYYGQKFIHHSI